MPIPGLVRDIPVYAGDDVLFCALRLSIGGVPQDLTGWTFRAQWRPQPGSSRVVDLDVDTSQASGGLLVVNASSEATMAMGGDGVWDIESTNPEGKIRTLVYGATQYGAGVTNG